MGVIKMTKIKFKELYSKVRESKRHFNQNLNKYPCGYGDSLAEKFAESLSDYLSDKPALKYAVNNAFEFENYKTRVFENEILIMYNRKKAGINGKRF
jgi:hypothetical protein